jgi:glycine/D-amino acid oxidase-like deaminating enzyme
MATTPDGFPRVGQVEDRKSQWMLCGFNGGGMTMIFTMAEAIAKMVNEGMAIEDTGLPVLLQNNATR